MFDEIRAGQNDTAVWYPPIVSEDGEQRRAAINGSPFWCKQVSKYRTDKAFRDGIEGMTVSVVLASTNLSKLPLIELKHGHVVYKGNKLAIQYAEKSEDGKVVYIALK